MRPAVALLCAALLTPACVRDAGQAGRLDVVTALYPLQFVVAEIGGEHVRVTDVVPPGAEPHDLELSPAQAGRVAQADLVVLIGGFQPALDDAAPDGDRTLDVKGSGDDPHVWLDPVAMSEIADRVAKRLAGLDSAHAADYTRRGDALRDRLGALHDETEVALRRCWRRDLVTSHAAFGRFAARYGLRQTGIAGVDPEAEPSPRRIAEVVAYARKQRVTTIFAETADDGTARTVAREAGAQVVVLDPAEVFHGDDYIAVMRRNLDLLRTALGCP